MSIGVSIMGGASTVLSTYMAKARGSGEPDISRALVTNLEQFIRECEAFSSDHGTQVSGDHLTEKIGWFRERLESLLAGYVQSLVESRQKLTEILVTLIRMSLLFKCIILKFC